MHSCTEQNHPAEGARSGCRPSRRYRILARYPRRQ